ncbi:Tm-1-like ATP-binding domain-containing protein, partial [Rhizobiaceae sp. 2RAB30]
IEREPRIGGIISAGGSGGTTLATAGMRALPVGIPKIMVSTVAAGDVAKYVGPADIMMFHSVADVQGLNSITEQVLGNAAHAMAGMVAQLPDAEAWEAKRKLARPALGITMFGVTTPCVQKARDLLEARGYEVLVFHATGTGGQSMEALIDADMLTAVLDATTTELADELVGGVFSAGPDRLTAAGRRGLPQIVSLGALDMVNFGPRDTVPTKFEGRNLYKHNPSITLMRTTPQECAALGKRLAERLSQGTGPRKLFVPLKGISMIAKQGQVFHDPEADAALIKAIKAHLSDKVELVEYDTDINDPAFAEALVNGLLEAITEKEGEKHGR